MGLLSSMRRLAGQKDAKSRKASVKSQAALAIAEAERHEQAENFEEAVENLEAAMQQLLDGQLEASPEYARCLELSAKIADAEGRSQDSLRFLSESLQLEQALGRLDSTEIASRSKQLVQAHVKDGNLAAASGMLENTLLLCEKKFGPDDAEVADLLADLAAVQQAGNFHQEALENLARALLIHERTAENQPTPELTRDLNLIAKSSQALGQFEAAAESLKRAMYLTERQLNADPRATAAMLLQFGRLEIAWQRPSAAHEHLMQAIALLDRYQNKDFADAQELLAQLYFKSGRYAEVEPRLQKARHVWMKDMAAHRGPLAENLLLHAESLDELKRTEEAEFLRKQAGEISSGALTLGKVGGRPLRLHARVRLVPDLGNLHSGDGQRDKADDQKR